MVAVASGKGGVGKSTTAVNLALALANIGQRVGLLDADIYGPSIGMLLNTADKRPDLLGDNRMAPISVGNLVTLSMANLVTDKTPMVWRGPMASGALQQMLQQTDWPELDVLLVDMPPGTGDIQLTLSQKVTLAGAVVVTTPQDLALLDAVKAIEMFRKVNVPILGLIENMSLHVCSQCGHQEPIFGEGGAELKAQEYGVPMLGRLPLAMPIRTQSDMGVPIVMAEPDREYAQLYRQIAETLSAALDNQRPKSGPVISVLDD